MNTVLEEDVYLSNVLMLNGVLLDILGASV